MLVNLNVDASLVDIGVLSVENINDESSNLLPLPKLWFGLGRTLHFQD